MGQCEWNDYYYLLLCVRVRVCVYALVGFSPRTHIGSKMVNVIDNIIKSIRWRKKQRDEMRNAHRSPIRSNEKNQWKKQIIKWKHMFASLDVRRSANVFESQTTQMRMNESTKESEWKTFE